LLSRLNFVQPMVPTPTVSAVDGALSGSPPKKRLLTTLVSRVRVLMRVRLVSELAGGRPPGYA